ncbi:MAG: hypothetical protein HOE62_13775 [Alphaproteobacteria bacterium]|nr:hypothetical protein [Alphaproteobacteria bacterium]MBT4019015.1 hypothetical protein [Alphaproteobacteria bacterium]MBT4965640.1 hypothetical protein [Alphaproteobacteria bacterium]MBT5159509.1 hypothetical protein [Alphaproteobacteria bacterium]MBT5917381.1 hypothetical protein [Alphaproteobacteria bacterium]
MKFTDLVFGASLCLTGFLANFAFAAEQPNPEIGTITTARQAAASPGAGVALDVMKNVPVRKGEQLITGPFGRMKITFIDDSEISIGPEANITLDDLVYSPHMSMANQFQVSVVSGAFRYLSGKIAKLNGPMVTLKTPLATIGIRGTHVLAIVDKNYAGCIVLLPTPGAQGQPSSITVTANGKSVVIDKPGWGTDVTGANTPPSAPRTWPRERIMKMLQMSGSSIEFLK